MLTTPAARDMVADAITANWNPGPPGRLDLRCFWLDLLARLEAHLQADPPDGLGIQGQVEGTLAMAGVVLLCWSFWLLQAKAISHGPAPHPTWRALLDWIRRSLPDLLRDARNLAADEKRAEQKAGTIPGNVVIPARLPVGAIRSDESRHLVCLVRNPGAWYGRLRPPEVGRGEGRLSTEAVREWRFERSRGFGVGARPPGVLPSRTESALVFNRDGQTLSCPTIAGTLSRLTVEERLRGRLGKAR